MHCLLRRAARRNQLIENRNHHHAIQDRLAEQRNETDRSGNGKWNAGNGQGNDAGDKRHDAGELERTHLDLVVSNMKKERRKGKVLVDWSQNNQHKTTVCVYSLRAKPTPTVSTPVTWDEVEQCLAKSDPDLLSFEAPDVLERIDKHGDLFEPVLELKQDAPKLK